MYSGPVLTVHRTQASFMHRVSVNYHQRWSDYISISPYSNKNKAAINARICWRSANFAHRVFFRNAKVFASIFAISVSCGSSKNLAPLVVAWARASYSFPKSRFLRLNVGKEMTQVILICLQPRKSFQRSFVWKDFFTTLQNWTA